MSLFTICGTHNCEEYVHAIFVAHYLQEHLPSFHHKKNEMHNSHWPKFVEELNKSNKWSLFKSPIIYKEVNTWGGKKFLIGGLSDFWEYCYCYYGLESLIAKCDLTKLTEDNVQFNNDKASKVTSPKTVIAIFGATERITHAVIEEILKIPGLSQEEILIKLHDRKDFEHRDQQYLDDIVDHYKQISFHKMVTFENFERHAIKDCDVLIHVEDFSRRPQEYVNQWLHRVFMRMSFLSDWINLHAKRSLKVILCNNGPICFMGSCLIEFCTILNVANIVAVTSYEGLSTLNIVSDMLKLPVAVMSAPPVWGFIGNNQFVDVDHIIYKARVYRPYERSITAPPSSTLPAGIVQTELRLLCHKVIGLQEKIVEEAENRKMHLELRLKRKPCLAKLRALVSLLNLWLGPNYNRDIVISLGVCSDGTFGIPAGLMLSQPVLLDEHCRWRPAKDFPLINENTKTKIAQCAKEAVDIFRMHMDTFPVETFNGPEDEDD